MLDKGQLPFTTDFVFGTEDYNITFRKEEDTFEPAIPPPKDHDPMDRDGFGDGKGGVEDKELENSVKKPTSGTDNTDINLPQNSGKGVSRPTPM